MKLGLTPAPETSAGNRNVPADQASYITLRPGDTLDDRFRLVETINQGGMATVFKAEDLHRDHQTVVIKVPLMKYASGVWHVVARGTRRRNGIAAGPSLHPEVCPRKRPSAILRCHRIPDRPHVGRASQEPGPTCGSGGRLDRAPHLRGIAIPARGRRSALRPEAGQYHAVRGWIDPAD